MSTIVRPFSWKLIWVILFFCCFLSEYVLFRLGLGMRLGCQNKKNEMIAYYLWWHRQIRSGINQRTLLWWHVSVQAKSRKMYSVIQTVRYGVTECTQKKKEHINIQSVFFHGISASHFWQKMPNKQSVLLEKLRAQQNRVQLAAKQEF